MLKQESIAQIFPFEQRKIYHIPGAYYHQLFDEGNSGYGNLTLVREIIVEGAASTKISTAPSTSNLFIPLVGNISIHSDQAKRYIEVGTVFQYYFKTEQQITISNSYRAQRLSFLHLAFKTTPTENERISSFDLNDNKDAFCKIWQGPKAQVLVGKFSGRYESVFQPRASDYGILAVALSGAFELENRLITDRDALFIQTETAEFESLAQEAILLIIEIKMNT